VTQIWKLSIQILMLTFSRSLLGTSRYIYRLYSRCYWLILIT